MVADAGYGDAAGFRQGLTDRGLTYVLAVRPTATTHSAATQPVAGAGDAPAETATWAVPVRCG